MALARELPGDESAPGGLSLFYVPVTRDAAGCPQVGPAAAGSASQRSRGGCCLDLSQGSGVRQVPSRAPSCAPPLGAGPDCCAQIGARYSMGRPPAAAPMRCVPLQPAGVPTAAAAFP